MQQPSFELSTNGNRKQSPICSVPTKNMLTKIGQLGVVNYCRFDPPNCRIVSKSRGWTFYPLFQISDQLAKCANLTLDTK